METTTVTTVGSTDITSGYVNVDWSTYQPINCYPVYPYGGYWPQPWVWPQPYYTPPPQYVTQQIVVPRGLTEEEIEAIAERVAQKMLARKRNK